MCIRDSSAAMAAEILPGKTVLEALNTDLVCDAINTAMRDVYKRQPLNPAFGITMPSGYCGGHGTAAAIGQAFSPVSYTHLLKELLWKVLTNLPLIISKAWK